MPAYVLVSAKGSPGVTTAAAALAAVATTTGRALLAELDPSGGSVHVLAGGPSFAGLVEAAGQLRRETLSRAIDGNLTLLPDGVPALLAPTAGPVAESVIHSVGERWVPLLRTCAANVLVDAGRWESGQRTARRVAGADLLVVVCRPTVAAVEHSRQVLDRLREQARRPAAVLVVGNRPYRAEEVAAQLDVPLAGTIAWDPRGAANLWASGVNKRWLRSWLARSASATLAGLAQVLGVPALPAGAVGAAAPTGVRHGPPRSPAPSMPPPPRGAPGSPSFGYPEVRPS